MPQWDPNYRWMMEQRVARTAAAFARHGIETAYVESAPEALAWVLADVPDGVVVGLGGSTSLRQMGLWDALDERGIETVNQQLPGLTKAERHEVRRRNVTTDYYVMSCNAISETGAILVANHTGNAVAALAFGVKRAVIVASVNKIVATVDDAMSRLFCDVAPANAHRSGEFKPPCYDDGICREDLCVFPDRICNKVLVMYGEALPGRVLLLLVGETMGF
ncbi:MAG: hypothetical protein GY788_32330 [bacterium]|nr:hypothetical protein [bacterium]